MTTLAVDALRPALYEKFVRPTPRWFADSALGVFVHWGAYSVPAWAEPIGALGAVTDKEYWYAHNPYAEWYANTIRIDGSPARERHDVRYGGAPYDAFLDSWSAEHFDAEGMVALFARAGARYVVPTTKHHDGIALWDAPGTGLRNTVHRGPRRDLVAAFAAATRAAGLRFGAYYSTGLDWHAAPMPAIVDDAQGFRGAPHDLAYARYVNAHLDDLITRYRPDMLWGDIDYPNAGAPAGPDSLAHVLERFYAANPEGVINDRFGRTHWDFRCSEYEEGAQVETATGARWQHTRGIGYSFGYNAAETADTHLSAAEAVRMLVDVVSRGGTLMLNIGPDAAGRIPPLQRRCLEAMAAWMSVNEECVQAARPFPAGAASEAPWARWTANDASAYLALAPTDGPVKVTLPPNIDEETAVVLGTMARVTCSDGALSVDGLPAGDVPTVLRFRRR